MQKLLFHYTTQAGLRGIIESKSLWFTNIFFLNDATEFEYTFKMVQEELEKKSGSSVSSVDLENSLIIEIMKSFSKYEGFLEFARYYVFSFTSKHDDLSQWRAYSDEGDGYCIEFDVNKISKMAKVKEWIKTTCLYDDEEQREKIRNVIDITYDSYKKANIIELIKTGLSKGENMEVKKMRTDLVRKLLILAPQFKHPKFREEAELRMYTVDRKSKGMSLRFRRGKTMIIPYLDISIAESGEEMPIKRIFIGPTSHPRLSKVAVEDLLMANSIDCEVKMSDIPYRDKL